MLKAKKLIRAASGIHVVAIMTGPLPCPGKCIYCFGGPEFGTPKSYLGNEPALMRAIQNDFHPYKQVHARLKQYVSQGHTPSKIELIVMGGTFTALSTEYQAWFISQALEAMNDFPLFYPDKRVDIETAKYKNEKARVRCIGLTLETRPDYANKKYVNWMLKLGATRVEIGVQTIYDDILELVRRGHTVEDVVNATRTLRDAGLKVVYHMMLALPGSDPQRDIKAFKEIFEDERFRPDMIKIYPTLVIEGSELYEWWKRGDYRPYSLEETIEVVAKAMLMTPPWVRIMRVQRDVPADMIIDGVKRGDLRNLAEKKLIESGRRCRCIRCREVGLNMLKYGIEPNVNDIKLVVRKYRAGGGDEIFISYEDVKRDILIGFLRLRIPSEHAWRPEIAKVPSAIVRELHVYGISLPPGVKAEYSWQHRGYGRKLLKIAERIAKEEYDARKILVMSGVGVKEYYRKLGYSDDGPYVSKSLN